MFKILTFLRLCEVLPEVDKKQQSALNGGKWREGFGKREALGKRLFNIHVILPVWFIQHGGSPGLVQKCRFTVHKRQCLSTFCTTTAVKHGLTVSALLRMSVATSAPLFGLLFWLHKYGRTGSDNPWKDSVFYGPLLTSQLL